MSNRRLFYLFLAFIWGFALTTALYFGVVTLATYLSAD